jgi:nitrite reductase/ring-hydroxylating ferredoxin subunit
VIGRTKIALTYRDGVFGAISGVCNHVGGPLGKGALDGDYVVCPWHYWKFHWLTGFGEPGFEADRVPVAAGARGPVSTECRRPTTGMCAPCRIGADRIACLY